MVALWSLWAGCGPKDAVAVVVPVAVAVPDVSPPAVPGGAADPLPADEPVPPRACATADDCPPDAVCEGEGCGDDAPGRCRGPGERACTRDLRPWCGCDGQTFLSSGTCPGRRVAHPGPCP